VAFSPSYIPTGQWSGRFDLRDDPPVLYLAESGAHAIAEVLQEFRGRPFDRGFLRRGGLELATSEVTIPEAVARRIVDLVDPATLSELGVHPDRLAHHERRVTQAIARQLHDAGHAGFRWWSSITGAWHATTLFASPEILARLTFGTPAVVAPGQPALLEALLLLGIS